MEEPLIVGFGRCNIGNYSKEELRASISRAFKDGHADYIVLDSNMRGQKFTAAAIALGIDQGWLFNDKNQDDGQCIVSSFRLTEVGKKEFLG